MIAHRDGQPLYGDYERENNYKEELDGFKVGDFVEFIGGGGSRSYDPDQADGAWNHRGWIWRLAVDRQEGSYAVVGQLLRDAHCEELNNVFQTLIVRVHTLKCYRKVNLLQAVAQAAKEPNE